ncbi:MAG: hypothetical protein RLW61_08320 [Gammaproteobacteria bacterium]
MRGPFHAAALAAALVLGSLSVGLLIVPAGAIVALATLRQGSREGLRVLALSTAIAVAVRLLLGGGAVPTLVLCLVVGLPSWLLAVNLARTERQAFSLLMIGALVTAYAVAIRAAVGDVTSFWASRLQLLFDLIAEDGGPRIGAQQVEAVAGMIHGSTLVAMFCMLAGVILLARWWQAVLYNPGGFGAEFRALRLPRAMLAIAAVCGAAVMMGRFGRGDGIPLAGDVFVVVVVLFAFQGLAVLHARARAISLASGWLAGLYVLLMLTPQVVGPILATTGVADSVADFRRLESRPRGGAD